MKNTTLILILSLVIVSCNKNSDSSLDARTTGIPPASTSSVSSALGEPFEMNVGSEVQIKGEDLSVRFVAVPSDSRCPVGATCPWTGEAVVVLNIAGRADSLHTPTQPSLTTYKTYTIKLLQLAPYPVLNVPNDPAAYVARLVVTKGN
jgi:hypothetical protein